MSGSPTVGLDLPLTLSLSKGAQIHFQQPVKSGYRTPAAPVKPYRVTPSGTRCVLVTCQQATVDHQLAAQNELGLVGGEVQHAIGDIGGFAQVADGMARDLRLEHLRRL